MSETVLPARSRPKRIDARPAAAGPHGLHGHPSHAESAGARAGLARLAAALAGVLRDLSTPTLSLVIAHVVAFCIRHVWTVILVAAVLAAGCGTYAARHFAINTDVTKLISQDLPWRQREAAYQREFTYGTQLIVAVIDAPTPELATSATQALVGRLGTDKTLFKSVDSMGINDFFVRNRLLYLPTDQVAGITGQL